MGTTERPRSSGKMTNSPDGFELLRIAKKRGMGVATWCYSHTCDLGDIYHLFWDRDHELTLENEEPAYEAWFDSNGNPHFKES